MFNGINVISTSKKRVIGYLKIMFIKELIHKIKIKNKKANKSISQKLVLTI